MNRRVKNISILLAGLLTLLSAPAHADSKPATAQVIRLGLFANVTHGAALVAKNQKFFEKYLTPAGTTIQYVTFSAGPAAIEALKGGAIDMAFIGPNPTISGYVGTQGDLLRIVAGSTSGGAELVVKPSITRIADLKGRKIASPSLGNTQDVALRSWLKSHGLKTNIAGGGDVTVIPTDNSQSLALFQRGDIDGAWLPEPWSSRLVLEAGAKVLINEKSLWPKGQFVSTNLVAENKFLNKYPDTISQVIQGEVDAINFITAQPSAAKSAVQSEIASATGKRLSDQVMDRAWSNLTFTFDPFASSLNKSASNAVAAGLLNNFSANSLKGIYDLRILNKILKAAKLPFVSARGLGLQ